MKATGTTTLMYYFHPASQSDIGVLRARVWLTSGTPFLTRHLFLHTVQNIRFASIFASLDSFHVTIRLDTKHDTSRHTKFEHEYWLSLNTEKKRYTPRSYILILA